MAKMYGSSPIIFTQYISFSYTLVKFFSFFYCISFFLRYIIVHYWDHYRCSFFIFIDIFFGYYFILLVLLWPHKIHFTSFANLVKEIFVFQHNLRLFKVMTNLKRPKRMIWMKTAQVFLLYHSSCRPSPTMTLRIFLGAHSVTCTMRFININFIFVAFFCLKIFFFL